MFLDLVSLFVGFICFLVASFMILNPIQNHKTNGYLVVILFIVGMQRFIYAIEVLGLVESSYNPLKKRLSLGFYLVPVYFLFFKRLIQGSAKIKKEFLHFILPTALILINLMFIDFRISRLIYLLYSIFYFVLILAMVKKFIYRKNLSILDKIAYRAIKTWLLLMIVLVLLLILYSNYFLFSEANSRMNLDSFYQYSSLLWFVILIYMFKNPVIIFGEYSLLKGIQLDEPQEFLVWSKKLLKPIEEKDKIVYNTILKRIDPIILEIQILQKSVPLLLKTTLTADTLAKEIKIPRRHLDLVFKYYCHYSINDFSNLVKINYAVRLIYEGYLETYTIASLGEKCLFNSRFTFSTNFKKFIGVSVSDFVKTNVNSTLFFGKNLSEVI